MRRSLAIAVVLVAGAQGAACSHYPTGALLDQASLDLTCPRDDIKVLDEEKEGPQHSVRGCGRAATYTFDTASQRWRLVRDDGMVPGPRR